MLFPPGPRKQRCREGRAKQNYQSTELVSLHLTYKVILSYFKLSYFKLSTYFRNFRLSPRREVTTQPTVPSQQGRERDQRAEQNGS